jgi:hypothetical protein
MNLYPYFKQMALDSGATDNVDLNTDTIKLLYLNGLTYDSTDKYVSDVLADAGVTEIGRSAALTSPTVTNGTFDAADPTTSGIAGGSTITDVVVFKDTGVDSSSVVIAHIDQDQSAAALSLATDGSPITATFDAAGIFDL